MEANDLRKLARTRWRLALGLSACVFVVYFGFIGLVAFAKDSMAVQIVPGISTGILLGALVIVAAWVTTWIYVHWANKHFDSRVKGGQ
jgi:uncharacterized membrane protein (DUF485 family)